MSDSFDELYNIFALHEVDDPESLLLSDDELSEFLIDFFSRKDEISAEDISLLRKYSPQHSLLDVYFERILYLITEVQAYKPTIKALEGCPTIIRTQLFEHVFLLCGNIMKDALYKDEYYATLRKLASDIYSWLQLCLFPECLMIKCDEHFLDNCSHRNLSGVDKLLNLATEALASSSVSLCLDYLEEAVEFSLTECASNEIFEIFEMLTEHISKNVVLRLLSITSKFILTSKSSILPKTTLLRDRLQLVAQLLDFETKASTPMSQFSEFLVSPNQFNTLSQLAVEDSACTALTQFLKVSSVDSFDVDKLSKWFVIPQNVLADLMKKDIVSQFVRYSAAILEKGIENAQIDFQKIRQLDTDYFRSLYDRTWPKSGSRYLLLLILYYFDPEYRNSVIRTSMSAAVNNPERFTFINIAEMFFASEEYFANNIQKWNENVKRSTWVIRLGCDSSTTVHFLRGDWDAKRLAQTLIKQDSYDSKIMYEFIEEFGVDKHTVISEQVKMLAIRSSIEKIENIFTHTSSSSQQVLSLLDEIYLYISPYDYEMMMVSCKQILQHSNSSFPKLLLELLRILNMYERTQSASELEFSLVEERYRMDERSKKRFPLTLLVDEKYIIEIITHEANIDNIDLLCVIVDLLQENSDKIRSNFMHKFISANEFSLSDVKKLIDSLNKMKSIQESAANSLWLCQNVPSGSMQNICFSNTRFRLKFWDQILKSEITTNEEEVSRYQNILNQFEVLVQKDLLISALTEFNIDHVRFVSYLSSPEDLLKALYNDKSYLDSPKYDLNSFARKVSSLYDLDYVHLKQTFLNSVLQKLCYANDDTENISPENIEMDNIPHFDYIPVFTEQHGVSILKYIFKDSEFSENIALFHKYFDEKYLKEETQLLAESISIIFKIWPDILTKPTVFEQVRTILNLNYSNVEELLLFRRTLLFVRSLSHFMLPYSVELFLKTDKVVIIDALLQKNTSVSALKLASELLLLLIEQASTKSNLKLIENIMKQLIHAKMLRCLLQLLVFIREYDELVNLEFVLNAWQYVILHPLTIICNTKQSVWAKELFMNAFLSLHFCESLNVKSIKFDKVARTLCANNAEDCAILVTFFKPPALFEKSSSVVSNLKKYLESVRIFAPAIYGKLKLDYLC